jgi:hypothetical protein
MKGADFETPTEFKDKEKTRIERLYKSIDGENLSEEKAKEYRNFFREGFYLGKEIVHEKLPKSLVHKLEKKVK